MEADLHRCGVDVRRPAALADRSVAQAEHVCKGETDDRCPCRYCRHGSPIGLVADVSCHPVCEQGSKYSRCYHRTQVTLGSGLWILFWRLSKTDSGQHIFGWNLSSFKFQTQQPGYAVPLAMFLQKPCDQLEVPWLYFTLQSAHEEEVRLLILLCQHSPLPCCSRSHLCRQRSQQYWRKQSCRFSGQLPVGRTGESTESWPSSFSVTPCSEKCQGRGKVLEMGVLWFFKRSTCRVLLTTGSSLQPIKLDSNSNSNC